MFLVYPYLLVTSNGRPLLCPQVLHTVIKRIKQLDVFENRSLGIKLYEVGVTNTLVGSKIGG